MNELLENIGSILTNLLSWLGSVATALIGNEVFQIMLAVTMFSLMISLLIKVVKDITWNKKREKYRQGVINDGLDPDDPWAYEEDSWDSDPFNPYKGADDGYDE